MVIAIFIQFDAYLLRVYFVYFPARLQEFGGAWLGRPLAS
jgi:hypothetical protein